MELKNRKIPITGGSRGIGAKRAGLFAAEGAELIPRRAAEAIAAGIHLERTETWVGETRLLPLLDRLPPALVGRILR